MILKFIGTGSGKTSLNRFHSSILINHMSSNCLVDCGDGISRSLLEQNIDYNSITSIIISHLHPDHFSGLLTLLINMRLSRRTSPIKIFLHEKLTKFFESTLIHTNLEGLKKHFDISINRFNNDDKLNIDNAFYLITRQNNHIKNKYNIEGQDVFYSVSLLFKFNDNTLLYTSDVGSPEDLYLFKDFSLDYMICETTHVSLKDILVAVDTFDLKHTYLTHIDNADEFRIKESLMSENLTSKMTAAFDGLQVSL